MSSLRPERGTPLFSLLFAAIPARPPVRAEAVRRNPTRCDRLVVVRVLVTGASGFIGGRLCPMLRFLPPLFRHHGLPVDPDLPAGAA